MASTSSVPNHIPQRVAAFEKDLEQMNSTPEDFLIYWRPSDKSRKKEPSPFEKIMVTLGTMINPQDHSKGTEELARRVHLFDTFSEQAFKDFPIVGKVNVVFYRIYSLMYKSGFIDRLYNKQYNRVFENHFEMLEFMSNCSSYNYLTIGKNLTLFTNLSARFLREQQMMATSMKLAEILQDDPPDFFADALYENDSLDRACATWLEAHADRLGELEILDLSEIGLENSTAGVSSSVLAFFLTPERFPNLRELILCGNRMFNVDELPLDTLESLKMLDLSGNFLTKLPERLPRELEVLILSNNRIGLGFTPVIAEKQRSKSIFGGRSPKALETPPIAPQSIVSRLKALDLSNNGIKFIHLRASDGLGDAYCLEHLILRGNQMDMQGEIQVPVGTVYFVSLPNHFDFHGESRQNSLAFSGEADISRNDPPSFIRPLPLSPSEPNEEDGKQNG